jgi:hypothetical protein
MNSDVAVWVRDCQACCRGKVTAQPDAPVQPIAVPAKRFHLDLVGPLPVAADGSTYLLTMVDRTTRWLEAAPLRTMEEAVCADTFIAVWVTRFGVPATVTTDRGRQFSLAVWSTLCKRLNIQHIETTAYHPQSNGMVERTHRQLKDALRARLAGPRWPEHLPWVLFGLRAAPKEDSGLSSAELVFGMPLTLPGQLLAVPETPVEKVVEELRAVQPLPTRQLSYAEATSGLQPPATLGGRVRVRAQGSGPSLIPLYQGPYRVLERSQKFLSLEVGGRTEVVNVDRLKPHLGKVPLSPALPPTTGRPRGRSPVAASS